MDGVSQRATIKDVARTAGVSPATVSQVLNGGRPVAKATKERIESVIAQLAYRPNAFAHGLKTLRSHLVGIVLPDLSNPFYPTLVRGVHDQLAATGYHAVIVNSDAEQAQERALVSELIYRHVDGLILITFTLATRDFASIISAGTPLVVIGPAEGVDHVHTNDFSAAFEMTEYLLHAGYSTVAHIAGPEGAGPAPVRMSGYRAAMSRHALGKAHQIVVHSDFTKAGGAKAMAELLELGPLPRAIFCANDLMALGAVEAAQAVGLSVPEDVAVAGFDDIEAASLVRPALTTVGHSAGELGARAAAQLLERIGGADGPPVDIEVGFELRKRASA